VTTVARNIPYGATVEWGLIVASYVILFFGLHWVGADGAERFDGLSDLLANGHISPVRYSLVGPLFSTPLWYIGQRWLGDPRLGCAYYNWVLLGIALVGFWRLLHGLLAPSIIRRFLLLLVAGSMFPNHVQAYYAEVFTSLFVALGVLCVCTKRGAWLGWIAIVLGAVNTPAAALAAGAVCLYFALDQRRLRFVIPFVVVVGLIVAEAVLRRGGQTGYEGVHQNPTLMPYSGRPSFSYPMFLGLLSLVLSFGKGIAFYAPGVFAPAREWLQDKPELLKAHRTWLVFLLGLLVVYAKFCGWYGGEFWGPRYVLFASIPASFALALNLGVQRSIARSFATLLMLTLSIWIGADGMVFGQSEMGECWANGYALEHLCWYVPEFAAWIRPFIVSHALEMKERIFLLVYGVVYVYLAAPIVIFLARAAISRCVLHLRRVSEWRAWGF